MTNRSEGGRWALGGYLYQLIGQLSLAVTPLGGWMVEDREIEARFLIDARGDTVETRAEALGQDASYIADEKVTLVQFKYSSTRRIIERAEIDVIIEKLKAAAFNVDNYEVTKCALVTNRQLADTAKQEWQATKRETAGSLELVLKHMELDEARQALDDFGRTYGALANEREFAVEQLLGRTFQHLGENVVGQRLTRGDFVEAMTGYRKARPLKVDVIAEAAEQDLRRFGREHFHVDQWGGRGVEREIYEDLIRATQAHALVVVSGPGGCGKSMLIWQLLADITEKREGACAAKLARAPDSILVPIRVNKWRGFPPGQEPSDTPDEAIERLVVANENKSKPILYLGLDGIDEQEFSGSVRRETEGLIQYFYSRENTYQEMPHPATLIISCRRKEQVSSDWLQLAPGREALEIGHITVDEFTVAELEKAMKKGMPGVYGGLEQPLAPLPTEGGVRVVEGPKPLDTPNLRLFEGSGLHAEILDMLRHPTMWQALLGLEEQTRERALRGDEAAVSQLTLNYLNWYHWKLRIRNRSLEDLDDVTLRQVIGAVAIASGGGTTHNRGTGWIDPACATDRVSRVEARELYKEAESVGMIVESERRRWRWRNEVLAKVLSRAGEIDD